MSTNTQKTGFNLQETTQGEVQVLLFSGCLSNDESYRVDRELARLLDQKHRRVILDLSLLSSATTMSLARLLVCAREFRGQGGELKLVGWSTSLKHLAELAGFDGKKDFAADVTTALQSMSPLSGMNQTTNCLQKQKT